MRVNVKSKNLPNIIAILVITGLSHQSYAADVANRTVDATKLLSNFSTLNNSVAGQNLLKQNLVTSLAVNNNSGEAQRQKAIYDNTLAALVGSMSNGLLVADAMGPSMSKIFSEQNSIERNYTSKTFSPNFKNLFLQVNSLIQIDSGFAKNYLANGTSDGKTVYTGDLLPSGGIQNVYDAAYNPLNDYKNPSGNSRPVQVVAGKDPAVDGKVDSFTGKDFFGDKTDSANDILPTVSSNASFPSGHSAFGFTSTLLFAQLLPEKFQDFALRGSEYGNSRVTLGVHYALDVIGARIMTTYTLAQILNNNPEYLNQNISVLGSTMQTTGDFKSLMNNAQKDLRNMLENGCNASISGCIAKDAPISKEQLAQNRADYRYRLTYGLDPIGDTTLAPVVPVGAEVLIETRFPYLTAEQRREVIATTEIESGHALDDGSGWARINLFDAAGGYGSINGNVSIYMDADKGGLNTYDVWNNDIGGNGNFEKNGTGTLELSGDNTFNGLTTINEGQLVVSGSLEHSNITVEKDGTISGDGKVGNLVFANQATYAVDINSNVAKQGLSSSGAVSLNDNNTIKINLSTVNNIYNVLGQSYQILSAANGITGQFAKIDNPYQFIDSTLSQGQNDVHVALTRNTKKFADIASNSNQYSVANMVENLNTSHPIYNMVIGSTSAQSPQIRQLYTEISGQVYADAFSSLLNESRYSRDLINNRLISNRAVNESNEIKGKPFGVWGSFIAQRSKTSNGNGIKGFDSKTHGFMVGVDKAFDEKENTTFGIVAGITKSDLDEKYDKRASANIDSYHVGIYGDHRIQNWTIRAGGVYSWNRVEASRTVAYSKLTDKYNVHTRQVFSELSYGIMLADLEVEPFVNLAYVNAKADAINENDHSTFGLTADKQSKDLFLSTAGARISKQWATSTGNTILFANEFGWQHQFNRDREYELSLNQSAKSFNIQSVAASKDGFLIKPSLTFKTKNNLSISASYSGLLSRNVKNHGLNLNVNWKF